MAAAGSKAPLLGESETKSGAVVETGKSRAEKEAAAEREFADRTDLEVGLRDAEVDERRREFGFNELPEKKVNPCLVFLSYFWGPMPIMIWLAIIVEVIQQSWEDFIVLMILQGVNGGVGYIEEKNAGNAVAALKNSLAPKCHCKRNGKFITIPARELVPGDVVELVIGDVVPADAILKGVEPLQVDQSALTGESLPVTISPGGKLKMGSAVKRGEANAVVCATGQNTFFGKAAGLIDAVEATGRFQQILFKITLWLLAISLVLTTIIFIDLILAKEDVLRALSVVIVLLVASIPIAMQVVCTSTMAVGSRRLAQRKVIVARLSAIEELAGMTILCSDKTGTLTQNKLSLRDPLLMGDMNEEEIIFYAALAAKRTEGNQDAIDYCITQAVTTRSKLASFKEIKFTPFNPTDKRTESLVEAPDGQIFKVTKGAPQVILGLAHNASELAVRVEGAVQDLADRGFRALGVAISYTGEDETPRWEFQGVLALFDPPRYDTKRTIETAVDMGVEVKMITGDQTAIAKETCRELGMGTNILNTEVLNDPGTLAASLQDVILRSNGFAEVYPEHKFQIVQCIREAGFVTGMTGDGVNDAPALKRADIGIAVEGATDAAKAAADIVLTEPGLSVIIEAIQRSRKIFQRMRNYCIYRIACTIQLLLFFFFAVLSIKPSDYKPPYTGAVNMTTGLPVDMTLGCNSQLWGVPAVAGLPQEAQAGEMFVKSFTLPVISLVIITILNDGTIITIAHDKVIPDRRPQKWDLFEVSVVSIVLGGVACVGSMVFLIMGLNSACGNSGSWYTHLMAAKHPASDWNHNLGTPFLTWGELQTMMYMKISLSDFLTVFAARTRGLLIERRPGWALATAFVFATSVSCILSLTWFLNRNSDKLKLAPEFEKYYTEHKVERVDLMMQRIAPSTAGAIWLYCLAWWVVQDLAKVLTYYVLAQLKPEDEERMKMQARFKEITQAVEKDYRASRASGLVSRRESTSSIGRAASQAAIAHVDIEAIRQRIVAIEGEIGKIGKLEREMEALKKLVEAR